MPNTLIHELMSGNPVIDFQHRLLFLMVKKLKSALKSGRGDEVLMEAVQFLDSYIIEHFNDEEEIQKECAYPNFEHHKAHHEQVRKAFLEFKNKIEKRGPNHLLLIEALTEISHWLKEHVKIYDKEFIKYYREYYKIADRKITETISASR